jgi:glycogen operon protein
MDGSRADILADKDDNDFFIMFNGDDKAVNFAVCDPLPGKRWVRAVDTALPGPEDITEPGTEAALDNPSLYPIKSRSMVVLISRPAD